MRRLFCLFLCLLLSHQNFAQHNLEQVKGLPTETIYNLLVDKKGFLWVAHSLGVSRYDGIKFTNFVSSEQLGLGVTNLTEDDQGRIWFHNFQGQIFYIENEKINLLKEYNYNKEQYFPSLLFHNGEIIATTSEGLFVCDAKTLKCKYINSNQHDVYSRYITICNNKVIAFCKDNNFYYKKDSALIRLKYLNLIPEDTVTVENGFMPILNLKDTIIFYSNSMSKIAVLKLSNDTVYKISVNKAGGYINTIKNFNNKILVNTKSKSYFLSGDNKDTINNLNLTDIKRDKFGNTWYSSLQNGLNKFNLEPHWKESNINVELKNDFIRSVAQIKDYTIWGTQFGKIIIYNEKTKQVEATLKLPSQAGSIEYLFPLPNERLFIGASIGQYFLNFRRKKIFILTSEGTFKNVVLTKTNLVFGYSHRITTVKLDKNLNNYLHNSNVSPAEEDLLIKQLSEHVVIKNTILNIRRCYVISYDSISNRTFCALKDGFYEIVKDSTIRQNNEQFSSVQSIIQHNKKIYLGTISRGLLIVDNQNVKKIDESNGLTSNIILQMKIFGTKIFLYQPNYIQVFDTETEKIIQTIPLPNNINGSIYDMVLNNDVLSITTSKSIYSIKINQHNTNQNKIYLLASKYESKEIEGKINGVIPYDYSSINLYIGFPDYNAINKTFYQYRLLGSGDSSWNRITTSVNKISFVSLKPGKYTFECNAVDGTQIISANTISYTFSISQPWWLTIWFIALAVVTIVAITAIIFKIRINIKEKINNQKIQRLQLEQKLTQSTLATIRSQMNPHFIFNALNTIQSFMFANDKISVNTYLVKFSKLIRTVLDFSQTELIPLKKEIQLIKSYTELENKRFDDAVDIHFNLSSNVNIESILIPPLLLQPYVENAFNHGLFQKEGDKRLTLEVRKENYNLQDFILVRIEDNGIGRKRSLEINKQQMEHKSFATNAGESRIELLNKTKKNKITLTILDKYDESENSDGTIVELRIPVVYKD